MDKYGKPSIFSSANPTAKSAYALECDKYQEILDSLGEQECMKCDPLMFWPTHTTQLPIHARIAAKILSAPATSAE